MRRRIRQESASSASAPARRTQSTIPILLAILCAFAPIVSSALAATVQAVGLSAESKQRSPLSDVRAPSPRPVLNGDAVVDAPAPELTATASFAVDLTSGHLLYQENPDTPLAPASTLKIVTTLTALSVLAPDEEITVESRDLVDPMVYSNAALMAGDIVSVEDLLAGALIPSGGDAAKALARVAGERLGLDSGQDPVDRFVEEMNRLSRELGMRNSNFINPDGADVEGQYTSARDLAIAANELLREPLLARQVEQPVYELTVTGPNARTYEVYNTNEMIGIDQVHGVKTGTTDDAGENVVLATRRSGNQILTVVMGSQNRYEDTQTLLDHVDSQVSWVEFGVTDDFPGVQSAAERFDFILATPMTLPLRADESDRLYSRVTLGPRPESLIPISWGYVVFLRDGEELYRVPVMTPAGTAGPSTASN